jgi:hypothetical protein
MRIGTVTAERMQWSRQSRATDAEIKALAEDIRDNGLQHPILVDAYSGRLVDGLNRLLAYKMLGWSVIPAVFFETGSEAADVLQDLRGGKVLDYRRSMEMYDDFRILTREWNTRRRVGIKKAQAYEPIERARLACSRAAGISENAINRLNMLINLSNAGNKESKAIVEAIYASTPGSPIVGFERAITLNRANRKVLPMLDEERVESLINVLKAAETALEQAFRIGGLHILPDEGRNRVEEKVKDLTRIVRILAKDLRRRI